MMRRTIGVFLAAGTLAALVPAATADAGRPAPAGVVTVADGDPQPSSTDPGSDGTPAGGNAGGESTGGVSALTA